MSVLLMVVLSMSMVAQILVLFVHVVVVVTVLEAHDPTRARDLLRPHSGQGPVLRLLLISP